LSEEILECLRKMDIWLEQLGIIKANCPENIKKILELIENEQ